MSAVVTTVEKQLPEPVRSISPMDIVQMAMDKGLDIERIEKLMEISERWRKVQAEHSFIVALAAFKADPPQVIKDAKNSQYKNAQYATIGNIVNTVNPFLGRNSLSASWDIDQSEPQIKVTCILEHIDGHRRQVAMKGPPDESGAKNELQKIRSTVTYLQVSTFQAVTGVIAINEDDDGNESGAASALITENQAADLNTIAQDVQADSQAFLRYMCVSKLADIKAIDYQKAVNALRQKGKQRAKVSQ